MGRFDKIKQNLKKSYSEISADQQFANDRRRAINITKSFFLGLFRAIILLGIAYVILGPLISMVSSSFFTQRDFYNPMVYIFPMEGTTIRYSVAIQLMEYFPVLGRLLFFVLTLMAMQVIMCSMVGYGFARFDFPCKNIIMGCVILMIVIPTHMIMLPLYVTFQRFDPLGLVTLINGKPINLLTTTIPMYIMTIFANGLRSGLFIYIFNQFFRGLPKEIEEAAFVDGAGTWYTYFRIMLINALPAVTTVAIFALVWQYNDTSFVKIFQIPADTAISKQLGSLAAEINTKIYTDAMDPSVAQLYTYAGAILVMLPMVLIYVILQKQFVEGVERSGIVG